MGSDDPRSGYGQSCLRTGTKAGRREHHLATQPCADRQGFREALDERKQYRRAGPQRKSGEERGCMDARRKAFSPRSRIDSSRTRTAALRRKRAAARDQPGRQKPARLDRHADPLRDNRVRLAGEVANGEDVIGVGFSDSWPDRPSGEPGTVALGARQRLPYTTAGLGDMTNHRVARGLAAEAASGAIERIAADAEAEADSATVGVNQLTTRSQQECST